MQPSSTDIFGCLIDLLREFRDAVDSIDRELELHIFGSKQRLILFDQGVLRLRQYPLKVVDRKRLKLDPDRKTSLQFRDQICRL